MTSNGFHNNIINPTPAPNTSEINTATAINATKMNANIVHIRFPPIITNLHNRSCGLCD